MDETTDTQQNQPIKRPRSRPRRIRPIEQHETPTIKEGASWHVGDPVWPPDEQDELRRRHNEALEKKALEPTVSGTLDAMNVIADNFTPPGYTRIVAAEPNSVVQIKVDPRMGQFALVGEVSNETLFCYQFTDNGIEHCVVKAGEYVLIGGPKKGMRVCKYERPEQAEEETKEG